MATSLRPFGRLAPEEIARVGGVGVATTLAAVAARKGRLVGETTGVEVGSAGGSFMSIGRCRDELVPRAPHPATNPRIPKSRHPDSKDNARDG
jgi:hypothetical protein